MENSKNLQLLFCTKVVLLLLAFLTLSVYVFAQPAIEWQKTLGGTKMDNVYSTTPTSDGGYISSGESCSNDGDVSGHHGSTDTIDIWIVKTDGNGNIQWQKSFGGTSYDYCFAPIVQTTDGGYIFAAITYSIDGDVIGNHGSSDVLVVKLDANGNIIWKNCYGGSLNENAQSIKQTSDGGFVILAYTFSNDGDVSGNHGQTDTWVLKLDAAGLIQWQKCLGGTSYDGLTNTSLIGYQQTYSASILQSSDGGYFVTTLAGSNDGDLTNHYGPVGFGTEDAWAVKLDGSGNIQWQKSFGGSIKEQGFCGVQTQNGNFIVISSSNSTDFDVVGNHGNYDAFIVMLDPSGNILNKKCLGGTGSDILFAIKPANEGGFLLAGWASSNNGDVAGNHGSRDFWLVKLDSTLTIQWQKCLGSTGMDVSSSIIQNSDGTYLISGWASVNDGDVSGIQGNHDAWLVKLYPLPNNTITGNIYADVNANCTKDTLEIGLANQLVKAVPGPYYAMTDANGNYTLFVDTGSYTVTHIPSTYYNQICPVSPTTYSAIINTSNPNSFNNNFGDTLNSNCADVKMDIGTPFLRRCFKNIYAVHYSNTGAVAADSVTITINFDSWIIPLSASIPYTLSGSDYIFNIGTLLPGQYGYFTITDSIACAILPGLLSQCAYATITTTSLECDTNNNTVHDCHYIIGSCDPNSKEVASQSISNSFIINDTITALDTLTYMIRFQNTGTDTAFTVVIRDTLSNYLDVSSVEIGASSHLNSFRIYGIGILEWTFNNILLPDSTTNEVESHGFVKFKVRQNPGNGDGTIIYNGSAIWFDYNDPVETNTTSNLIPLFMQVEENVRHIKNTISVFPNPFTTTLHFTADTELFDAQLILTDVIGKEVFNTKTIFGKQFSIEPGNLPVGIYSYRIIQNGSILYTGKLIAE